MVIGRVRPKCKTCKANHAFFKCKGDCWSCASFETKLASGYKCSQPACECMKYNGSENCWKDSSIEEKEATGRKCIIPGCPKQKKIDDCCKECSANTEALELHNERTRLTQESFTQALEESTTARQNFLYEVENRSEATCVL
jgi:hypothetical protein